MNFGTFETFERLVETVNDISVVIGILRKNSKKLLSHNPKAYSTMFLHCRSESGNSWCFDKSFCNEQAMNATDV